MEKESIAMIKTVYVPLDGSEVAEAAIGPATAIASRAGADLVLMAAPWPDVGPATPRRYLDVRAAFVDVPVRTWFVPDTEPAAAIALAADEPDALLCMATRGRGALRRALLGSVAEAAVRASHDWLLLVGPAIDPEWRLADAPVVLAGVDGSEYAHRAALAAGEVAAAIGGSVRLVEVLHPTEMEKIGAARHDEIKMLEALESELRGRGVTATFEAIDGFDPVEMLIGHILERDDDLLALGSHGRTGLRRVAMGSVSMRAVTRAPCPVLVTGPGQREG